MILTALAQLLVAWLICFAIGYGAIGLLLPRDWARDRAVLAPVIGAAVLALVSGWFSYAGLSMRTALPLVCMSTAACSAAGVIVARRRGLTRTRYRLPLYVQVVGGLGGASALTSLVMFHAWNIYTDAFT